MNILRNVLCFTLLLITIPSIASEKGDNKNSNKNKIQWLSLEQAIAKSKKHPKKILMDVYTDWCGYCKKMDRETFGNATVAKFVNEHFYAVKFNAEQKESVTFKGEKYDYIDKGNGRGVNALAPSLLQNKLSYPTIVYLTESLDLIQPVPGFLTASQILPVLSFFGEDHYKTKDWKQFMKIYNKKNNSHAGHDHEGHKH